MMAKPLLKPCGVPFHSIVCQNKVGICLALLHRKAVTSEMLGVSSMDSLVRLIRIFHCMTGSVEILEGPSRCHRQHAPQKYLGCFVICLAGT